MKKTILTAMLPALLLAFASPPARAEMTREEVESIVRDYIAAHPQDILESVQRWQDLSSQQRQQDALQRNRIELFDDHGTPVAGNTQGDVTVVEFFDYNCGYCKKVMSDVRKLIGQDKNVRVLFKELPILGPSSETASKWALAAHMQGKYFDFHTRLMDNRKPLTDELLAALGKDAGLDLDRLRKDIQGTEVLVQIERNRSLASNMGISGTPAFIIGDQIVPGAISYAQMKEMIDAAREGKKAE